MKRCLLIALVALLVAGCASWHQPSTNDTAAEIHAKADKLCSAGDTKAAIDVLDKAVNSKKYAGQRHWMFGDELDLMLAAGRIAEAKARYLAVIGKDQELERGGFSAVSRYYRARGDVDALVEWTGKLLEAPLPGDLAAGAFEWRLNALLEKGQYDQVIGLVPECAKRFAGLAGARILGSTVKSLIGKGRYDDAARLLDAVDKEAAGRPDWQRMAAVNRVNLLSRREQGKVDETNALPAAANPRAPDRGGR
jgi:tetratricopeptide (TPR) repeat protein